MTSVHDYKQLENSIVQRIKNAIFAAGRGIIGALQGIGHLLARRYTVVFVPHSEKRVYNLQITVLSMFLFLLVTGSIIGAFCWYSASYNSPTRSIAIGKDSRLKDVQASLDQLRDETALLRREAQSFEEVLSGAFAVFNSNNAPKTGSSDLESFFNIKETQEGTLQEVEDIRQLSAYLSSAVVPVKEITAMLNSQSSFLKEIPSIWPVKGGIGHISMYFGQNPHPFFGGQYYIHKGIDISTHRSGDPVVTTADGQVVTVAFSEDFGNYVLIKHKHGYYTRYAHLLSNRVRLGQKVQQGEVIGYIGNTGLSTGPHLHYEIRIGSDVVDPYNYINIRSSIAGLGR